MNIIPPEVKVGHSESFKDVKKQIPKDVKIQEIKPISDWTLITPYKGTVMQFKQESSSKASISVTKEEIPVHRLGQDNPLIFYDEITLFEDELQDYGFS